MTIVPGSGGAKGQQVASCDGDDGRDPVNLYCNMTAATSASASGTTTGSTGALSLQAHFTIANSVYDEGPVVHRGCSTIMMGGKPYPEIGQCCFV